jgi:hypothetical protein
LLEQHGTDVRVAAGEHELQRPHFTCFAVMHCATQRCGRLCRDLMGCTDGEGVCVRTANAELQELNSLRKKRSGSDPDPAEAGEESASRASVKEKADPSGKSRLRDHNLSVFAQTVKPLRPHAVRVVAVRSRRQVLMMN